MSHAASTPDLSTWDGFVERLYRQSEFSIKLGLEAIGEALRREGRPDRDFPIILVAGTNGKGETAAFLAAILQAHGLTVGLYTSPHIIDLRERFRVDGRLMERDEVHRIGREVIERYGEADGAGPQLTFFELTTMMAVLGFAERQVDVGVFEVGLGGRLDATNALDAQLSVVTSIGLDHTAYLGDTLTEVAGEKAGIFRPDRPAVVGHQTHDEARRALESDAPDEASFYGQEFVADDDGRIVLRERRTAVDADERWPPTRRWNAACAAEAGACFLGGRFDARRAADGLAAARWPGRLDLRRLTAPGEAEARSYLFDAAHNPDAAAMLFDFVEAEAVDVGAVVCSGMKDKDLGGTYARLPTDVPVYAVELDSPRGARAVQLREALAGKSIADIGPTDDMLARARRASPEKTILVFGSIYLLGECFRALGVAADSLVTFEDSSTRRDR